MAKTSIVGTIKKIDVVKTSVNKEYVLKMKEHNNWSLVFDNNYYRRNRSKFKKGGKYLFEGDFVYFKPSLIVHEVVARPSAIKPGQITGKGENNTTKMAVTGKISKIKIFRTMKLKQKMAYVEFEDFPEINTIIFPDIYENFNKVYKKGKNITVIGLLDTDKPKFVVTKATKLT